MLITKELEDRLPSILADMAADDSIRAANARRSGDKLEASYFQRSANSYAKAAQAWLAGIRPTDLTNGRYILPSLSEGPSHIVSLDTDWTCTCAAGTAHGNTMHWAIALMIGIEHAEELIDLEDDMPSDLGRRLALARAALMAA